MNPSSKGWLKEYLTYYKSLRKEIHTEQAAEDYIYNLLSKSSLLFSIPLDKTINWHPDFSKWNLKEKIKIVFADHLFRISEFYIKEHNYALEIDVVYQRLEKELNSNLSTEEFIDQLIIGKKNTFLLNAFNINPWAFLSLIEFYYQLNKEPLDVYQIKLDIIKGMLKAAKAHENISNKEAQLIKRYIENGGFSESDENILYKYSNIKIFETNFSNTKTIINIITYDFALLSLMTDNELVESELQFINQYAETLGISIQEQYQTFSLIQNIHLNHYKLLSHLHKKYSFKSVKNIVAHNFKFVLKKNSSMIINEIRESKELLRLLRKSTDKKLSEEEKIKVREQTMDLLKTIPSLTIFMIPGGTILLPILIKILPKDLLFPSSFINKNSEE